MPPQDDLKIQIRSLPDAPGVYRYYDREDTLIYVGKAKSIRKRVSSYFTKNDSKDRKTWRLVLSIRRIEYTVVNTEFEALLLENNLIKQYQPKYNINLKDDKSYPFIIITNDRFPKIYATRQLIKGKGQYFGPYASVQTMKAMLELLRKVFTFRTCNLHLSEENIKATKFKVCLEYHLGNCKGPCEGLQAEEDYTDEIRQATKILKGSLGPAKSYFKERMVSYAENLEFEKAQRIKDRLALVEKYESKSLIVNPDLGDFDVFTMLQDGDAAFVNYLQIRSGLIVNTDTVSFKRKMDETDEELMQTAILNMRTAFMSDASEILTNTPILFPQDGVKVTVPQQGDKKKLVDLSVKNTIYYKHNKEEKTREQPRNNPNQRILLKLQQDLRLTEYPDHIECFDNSNIQGTNPVSAMVCFKNGVPSKKDYRHFKVKTVKGPDDFATMEEVVFRRYRRQLDENQPLPKLIIIDGGKGQLSAAVESLRTLDLYGKIPIVGIAKRLEELYFPNDPYPLHLEKKSESLKLIQRLRDEAHRFGITHHRDLRSAGALKLTAQEVRGLGPKTMEKVQIRFKSLKSIKAENLAELATLIGQAKADLLARHLGLQAE